MLVHAKGPKAGRAEGYLCTFSIERLTSDEHNAKRARSTVAGANWGHGCLVCKSGADMRCSLEPHLIEAPASSEKCGIATRG